MFKRFFLSLALMAGLLSPTLAAGTIPFSLSQQLDNFGKPLAGCQFYTIQAGTTSTPQNAFQDSALTIPLPNPQTCDAAGRLGQMFIQDGSIKVRLTDKNGVTVIVADNIQVIGNSSGGGGGSPVDPTTVLATGDMKVTYGSGVVTGFVRANGRTIGSATSGASERANADCQALFIYLWSTDPNLTVSTGRGASASADWAANKQITLPDWRGRTIAGLGDMGNTDAGRLTSGFFGATPTTLGAAGGAQAQNLTVNQLPAHIPNNAATTISGTSTSPIWVGGSINNTQVTSGSSTVTAGAQNVTLSTSVDINPSSSNSGVATIPPTMLTTIYIKL